MRFSYTAKWIFKKSFYHHAFVGNGIWNYLKQALSICFLNICSEAVIRCGGNGPLHEELLWSIQMLHPWTAWNWKWLFKWWLPSSMARSSPAPFRQPSAQVQDHPGKTTSEGLWGVFLVQGFSSLDQSQNGLKLLTRCACLGWPLANNLGPFRDQSKAAVWSQPKSNWLAPHMAGNFTGSKRLNSCSSIE